MVATACVWMLEPIMAQPSASSSAGATFASQYGRIFTRMAWKHGATRNISARSCLIAAAPKGGYVAHDKLDSLNAAPAKCDQQRGFPT